MLIHSNEVKLHTFSCILHITNIQPQLKVQFCWLVSNPFRSYDLYEGLNILSEASLKPNNPDPIHKQENLK